MPPRRRTSLAAEIDGTDDLKNEYAYDYLNRMTQVTQAGQSDGNAVAEKRVDFTYDAEDKYQFTSITRYADLAGTETVATSTYGYDSADQLTSLMHVDGDSSTLAGYTYSYDEGNRLTGFSVYGYSAEDASYSYDDTDQLTGANRSGTTGDESYTYDENGNRTGGGYTTGDNNQVTSDGTHNYTYDDEGNRLTKTNISTGELIEYGWDYRNRLTSITTKDNLGTVTHAVEYTYDAFNRRILKSIDADGAGVVTAAKEAYIYDGLRGERGNAGDHILVAFDELGNLTDRFMYGPNVDQAMASEVIASTASTGDVLWALTDKLDTVRDLAQHNNGSDTISIVNHLAYNSFGEITSETNSAVDYLFGFSGREKDKESSLYYYRGRHYEASLGRFISEDPLGFNARDENLTRYARGNVMSFTDPSGMAPPLVNTGWWDGPIDWEDFGILGPGEIEASATRIYQAIPSNKTVDHFINKALSAIANEGFNGLAGSGFDTGVFNSVVSRGKYELMAPFSAITNEFESHRNRITTGLENRWNRMEQELHDAWEDFINPNLPFAGEIGFPYFDIDYSGFADRTGLNWSVDVEYNVSGKGACSGTVVAKLSGKNDEIETWQIRAKLIGGTGASQFESSLVASPGSVLADASFRYLAAGVNNVDSASIKINGGYSLERKFQIGTAGFFHFDANGLAVSMGGGGTISPTGGDYGMDASLTIPDRLRIQLGLYSESGLNILGEAKW